MMWLSSQYSDMFSLNDYSFQFHKTLKQDQDHILLDALCAANG
jgi:hypothetical protein